MSYKFNKWNNGNNANNEESLKNLREEIAELSDVIQEPEVKYENMSKLKRKLIEADELIKIMMEKESKSGDSQHDDLNYSPRRKRSKEILRPLHLKFASLNQKADKFLKSLQSHTSLSTIDMPTPEGYYANQMNNHQITKLPLIQKSQFYDPTPIPAEFKINKNLMAVY